ncbi:hypothetical protein T4B_7392 [Trichinella pseudospiralis]|nr:hypothetical protein T4A_13610 [Trichinella pseudospiralis]KRZ17699.1 hypothetical protein T4B_7392 [Trichinella pseudospiralis]
MDLRKVKPEDEEWVPKATTTSELQKVELSSTTDCIVVEANEAPEVGYNVEKCNVPRNKWKIGRIIEIYPGNDGIARTTKLRTSTGITKRSTAKLYLIEPAVPN